MKTKIFLVLSTSGHCVLMMFAPFPSPPSSIAAPEKEVFNMKQLYDRMESQAEVVER